jgi:glutamate-1-semialdehyde 2,1-aminomutase
MNPLLPWATALIVPLAVLAALRLVARLRLSRAKAPTLAGHPRIAKRLSRQIRGYAFRGEDFFTADGADPSIARRRSQGFDALAEQFRARSPKSAAMLERIAGSVSDLQFVGRYRVPFPFSARLRERLRPGVIVQGSDGMIVRDIDGNRFTDLTGAYGVNVFGNERYKHWIRSGVESVAELGPVLGPYHPLIEPNVERIKRIAGLDEVSFHMSGTEAVMQAVRLARYHTGRSHAVRFAGAYHGWWDDVQPGIGNPSTPGKVHTLAELSEATLQVLRTRRDIACVLVNPLQALHPNRNAPGDGSLVLKRTSGQVERARYAEWLQALRAVCTERGIVLILDEIFTGFRLARRGAQEHYGIQADLVTYGKTLGGGLPVGVLCGRSDLMKRYREGRPADICFARGTFNSHPCVLGTMNAFLDAYDDELRSAYDGLDPRWEQRAAAMNASLDAAELPFRVDQLSSIFTTIYPEPSRYHWMLQFYLSAEQLLLPWVGTGRFLLPIDLDAASFDSIVERFVAAGRAMRADGWWDGPSDAATLRRRMIGEALRARTARATRRTASA